jgi:hypothetical protein
VVTGVFTVSGMDKTVEAMLVDRMPEWLLELATRL